MLTELRVRDFAIIDNLTLSLAEGFNVLSGETGAGKSIIVGALGLLLGERSNSEHVRSGSERAIVEGTFDATATPAVLRALREQGVPSDDNLVTMRREVQSNGRGRAWINDFAVNVATLATIGRQLASIHGQHEAQSLLDVDSQRDVLDEYAGAQQDTLRAGELHARLTDIDVAIAAITARGKEAASRSDYLQHVIAEIRGAKLKENEEEQLDAEASRLEHAVELTQLASEGLETLGRDEGGMRASLRRIRKTLDGLRRIDPSSGAMGDSLESAEVVISELTRDLEDYAGRVEVDPVRLASVNERRAVLFRIARKYGGTIREALAALESAERELKELQTSHEDLAALETERPSIAKERFEAAVLLTQKRTAAAAKFSKKVTALLPSLGMPGATLHIVVSPLADMGAAGADSVEFLVAINEGHDRRALAKTASGGELSRIMLAIKSILADLDRIPSLVFDEVDAGIGGQVALQVGDALRSLAKHHQVLVITHLPQIAARAHRHVIVRKLQRGGVATADVQIVEGGDRVAEITRMLSGDAASKTGRKHAEELLHKGGES